MLLESVHECIDLLLAILDGSVHFGDVLLLRELVELLAGLAHLVYMLLLCGIGQILSYCSPQWFLHKRYHGGIVNTLSSSPWIAGGYKKITKRKK